MEPHELKCWMQSVRSGGDALSNPDFAPLADHLAEHPEDRELLDRELQFDATLAAAMREALIPQGLEERLLARLQIASQDTAVAEEAVVSEVAPLQPSATSIAEQAFPASLAAAPSPAADAPRPLPADETAPTDEPAAPARRLHLRRWVAATAAGVLALIGVQWWYEANRPVGWDEVLAEARGALPGAQAMGGPAAWQTLATAPSEHPFGPWLDRRQVVGWLPSPNFLNRRAVVYWLADPGGKAQGFLFVSSARRTGPLPAAPGPFENSGGVWATGWRSGDSLYALAAVGERADLERAHYFLRPLQLTRLDGLPPAGQFASRR